MKDERKPYTLCQLHNVLEKIKIGKEDNLNLPSAFLCLVCEILELIARVEALENFNDDLISESEESEEDE